MVSASEHVALSCQLLSGKSSSEEIMDITRKPKGQQMGNSRTLASLSVPPHLRASHSNERVSKKFAPFVHLPSPHCNYSQGSEQEEKKHVAKKSRHSQTQRALHRFVGNSVQPAKKTDSPGEIGPAETLNRMGADTIVDMGDEAFQSGKEVSRCGSENLDSSLGCCRRENFQGNTRHICKYCAKEFSSGRALGGHMRAHGSLSVEWHSWITNPGCTEKQQVPLSDPHYSNNTDSDSEHTFYSSVKQEGSPPCSKRSRRNGKELQNMRSVVCRSKNNFRQETSVKNSDEIDHVKLEENSAGAPTMEPEPSMSSDVGGNNDASNEDTVTDGAVYNVCNVCDREFEDGKQLNTHKESHGLYALRRNPKRSRRFVDQDYLAEVSAVSVPAKRAGTMFSPDGNMHACTECSKRFQSWKALFGHMRCHPERNWRGIHRPDVAKDKQDVTSCVEKQLASSGRKDTSVINDVSQESDSKSGAKGRREEAEPTGSDKAAASDNESDAESIEAAYMNVDRQPSSRTGWMWMTGKRSKRSRQTVRTLQAVTKTAVAPITAAENEMEHETAVGLMMLARKGGGDNWLEGQSSDLLKIQIQYNSASEMEGNELEEYQTSEIDLDLDAEELASTEENVHNNNKEKAKIEAMDTASFCKDSEEGVNDCEDHEQGAGTTKLKYACNTCKRVFKSHQALGGHRASHKRVKGCFARTNVNGGAHDILNEEMTSEELARAEEQLLNDFQHLSQSEGYEKEIQLISLSKEDSGEIVNVYQTKSKGHMCTICGRNFNSGQALGGHKRCHYNMKEETSSEATSSTNNTIKQTAAATCEFAQQGDPTFEEAAQMQHGRLISEEFILRQVKEKFLDLNLPAPVNEDDMELETYDIPSSDLICTPQPTSLVLKGAINFPVGVGKVKSPNFNAEGETCKQEYFPLYSSAKYASRVEENNPDLGGGQETDFRGCEVDFSLRYVLCNICDRQFTTVEALSNHEKTHASMMSCVSGLTPISA